ncbi:MAG: DUF4040 domain-containing protein, partial [Actinomycetota bacterium]|nr:DUF4040 domain-containing protein [Actinomycetota bacterium]
MLSSSDRAARRAAQEELGPEPQAAPVAARLVTVLTTVGFVAALTAWLAGGGAVDVAWAPALDLHLAFGLDGLGALYALLASGVGAVVLAYSVAYLPRHLRHEADEQADGRAFYGWLGLFVVSMVGLATSQDLILLFVFFDLTAVCSYFLIGFHKGASEARWGALVAFTVTGVTAVLLLLAALVLHSAHATFSIPELTERMRPGGAAAVAGALVVVAALAKSAQVPFHFWLRRAMVAPTPVSAYLHSAAMVAAGVLVLGRLHPLLALTPTLLDVMVVAGFASVAVGGVLTLAELRLKPLLAYSTVSQYGYVTAMYGLGGAKGTTGAALYVLMHGLAKSALFLTAGAVTEATGEERLDRLGRLAGRLPGLAAASGVAVAAIVALPLTLGFFADEVFFKAALEHGTVAAVAAVGASALTFAYMGRFWLRLFLLGPGPAELDRPPRGLVAPVAVLALVLLAGGIASGPFVALAEAAGAVSLGGRPAAVDAAYKLEPTPANLLALLSWGTGALLVVLTARVEAWAGAAARLGRRLGPDRAFAAGLHALNVLSDRVHRFEVRGLRVRVAAVLVPGSALVLLAVLATPLKGLYTTGGVAREDIGLVIGLAVAAAAAVGTGFQRDHLRLVLGLSATGFSLAAVYALFGAPDVALVSILVEITLGLLFLATLGLLPADLLRREAGLRVARGRRLRDVGIAAGAGTG